MAERSEDDGALDELLAGWGTPEPRVGFVDRVSARIDGEARIRSGARRRSLLSFVLGGVVGGLVVAAVASPRSPAPRDPSSQQRMLLQAPGVAEVVGEPGSQLYWTRRDDGRMVLELREGTAWVRRATVDAELGVIAGGDEIALAGMCARVEVIRGLLSVDANIDDVECGRVDEAIEQIRAELSPARSR